MEKNKLLEAEKILNELEYSDAPIEKVEQLKEIFGPMIEKEKGKEFRDKHNIQWSWGGFVPHTKLQDAISTLTSVVTFHQEAKIELEKYHDIQQDLLHAFELTNPTDDDLIQLGKQVVELQKKRRQTKNFIEITEPLFNYVTNNRHVTKQLGKVHGEMLGIIKVQSNRKYTPKEKTSLQEAFDKAQNLATV